MRTCSSAEIGRTSVTDIFSVYFASFAKSKHTPKVSLWHAQIIICFCLQLEGDERSDEESQVEEEDGRKGDEDDVDQDFCWKKGTLNSKLSMLTSSYVLNNLANHRASLANKMRKAQ